MQTTSIILQYRTHTDEPFQLIYGVHESPFGLCVVGERDGAVCAVSFIKSEREAVRELKAAWPQATLQKKHTFIQCRVLAILSGKRYKAPLMVSVEGTDFQRAVWQTLLEVLVGQTISYQALARKIHKPKAVRAVGTAVGKNPIAYLIPCHRVVRADGAIGQYHWGAKRKRALLQAEGVLQ